MPKGMRRSLQGHGDNLVLGHDNDGHVQGCPGPEDAGDSRDVQVMRARTALVEFVELAKHAEISKLEAEAHVAELSDQLTKMEERVAELEDYKRSLEVDHQSNLSKLKEDLKLRYQKKLEDAKSDWQRQAKEYKDAEVNKALEAYARRSGSSVQFEEEKHALLTKISNLEAELTECKDRFACPLCLDDLDSIDCHVALLNQSNCDISLAGWLILAVGASKEVLTSFEFPEDAVLASGSRACVWWGASNAHRHCPPDSLYWNTDTTPNLNTNPTPTPYQGANNLGFRFVELQLEDPHGLVVHTLTIPEALPAPAAFKSTVLSPVTLASPEGRYEGPITLTSVKFEPDLSLIVRNRSGDHVSLAQWRLTSFCAKKSLVFGPTARIPPHSAIVVRAVSSSAVNEGGHPTKARFTQLWFEDQPVDPQGDTLYLYNPNGVLICSAMVPPQQAPNEHTNPDAEETSMQRRLREADDTQTELPASETASFKRPRAHEDSQKRGGDASSSTAVPSKRPKAREDEFRRDLRIWSGARER